MNRVKIYAKTIESEALEQINNMSNSEAYYDCIVYTNLFNFFCYSRFT